MHIFGPTKGGLVTAIDGEAVACSGLDLCRLWRLHCVSVVAVSVCTALLLDVAKSPDPLSQPPRNPKGVLAPTHHDVPPTHFFLFFKGCTATSDGILASHLWLLQVTEFLVSQVTCPPQLTVIPSYNRGHEIIPHWKCTGQLFSDFRKTFCIFWGDGVIFHDPFEIWHTFKWWKCVIFPTSKKKSNFFLLVTDARYPPNFPHKRGRTVFHMVFVQ